MEQNVIDVNNILVSINESLLSVNEANTISSQTFLVEKDKWDATLGILMQRNSSNTTFRLFYKNAGESGINYERIMKELDIFIIGGF